MLFDLQSGVIFVFEVAGYGDGGFFNTVGACRPSRTAVRGIVGAELKGCITLLSPVTSWLWLLFLAGQRLPIIML